jgi:hypothetical protein
MHVPQTAHRTAAHEIEPFRQKLWADAAGLIQWPLLVVLHSVLMQHEDLKPRVSVLLRPHPDNLPLHLEDAR